MSHRATRLHMTSTLTMADIPMHLSERYVIWVCRPWLEGKRVNANCACGSLA